MSAADATTYFATGWNVIPLPAGKKKTPPDGLTGWRGRYLASTEGYDWSGNIALRVPPDVIGLDVDVYAGGDRSLKELVELYGPLPPTWWSSSRDDGSGIGLFRVPFGTTLVTNPAEGVQIVQASHRYAICAPSIHPEGRRYRWRDEQADEDVAMPPHPAELPELPWAWIDGLRSIKRAGADAATPGAALEFVEAHTANRRPAGLVAAIGKLAGVERGGRHDALVSFACWLAREAAAGWYPAGEAFDRLRDWYRGAVADDPRRAGGGEFASAVLYAIGQALADPQRIEQLVAKLSTPFEDSILTNTHAEQRAEEDQGHQEDEPVPPMSLTDCHDVFRRWLGAEYDLDAIDASLAAEAVERMDGDPLWLLVISGSGNAKTETVQALGGAGAVVTSTITSAGALLSATSRRERTKVATGGLLRRLGDSGTLVIKDVTSILTMDRNARPQVLAALREVYDGRWERNVGTDGGRSLEWIGRIAVVGAVTTAWDRAHDVVSAMGDRFVLLRMDSTTGRVVAGRRSVRNTGQEVEMRRQLAEAAGGVIAGANLTARHELTDVEIDQLLGAADLVTRARTAVDVDYRGDVIDAHAPEMPTRFAKELAQVVRGSLAIGMARPDAMRLAMRCARDSMPPMRLTILEDVAMFSLASTSEVRKRIDKPYSTVSRQLQALHMLGLLVCDEIEGMGMAKTRWLYSLAPDVDPTVLARAPSPEM